MTARLASCSLRQVPLARPLEFIPNLPVSDALGSAKDDLSHQSGMRALYKGSMFGTRDIGKLKLDVKIWVTCIFEERNIHSFHQILNTQKVKKISASANKYARYNLLTA